MLVNIGNHNKAINNIGIMFIKVPVPYYSFLYNIIVKLTIVVYHLKKLLYQQQVKINNNKMLGIRNFIIVDSLYILKLDGCDNCNLLNNK